MFLRDAAKFPRLLSRNSALPSVPSPQVILLYETQQIETRESPRTIKLYDPTNNAISLETTVI